jgi:hypothetical protein
MLAQTDPATHPCPEPALAAPVRLAELTCGVAANASLTAVTARRCASLDNPGGTARYGKPQAARPGRVSQTRAPALSTAVSAVPAARQWRPAPRCAACSPEYLSKLIDLHPVHLAHENERAGLRDHSTIRPRATCRNQPC